MKHYQDFSVFDLWAEIRKLPSMEAPSQSAVRATGTYNGEGVVPGLKGNATLRRAQLVCART